MREIHRELEQLKGTEDPIAAVAERTARRYRLVCFDEFHVSDIADAMILGRFLEQVMERGVEFVMTSNYHPDQLYPNGLQRERFLPAIELLKERLDVVEVDNGTDYRRLKMEQLKVYHTGAAPTPSWSGSSTTEGRGGGEAAARRRGPGDSLPQARRRPGMVRLRRCCAAGRAPTPTTSTWRSASTP